MKKVWCILVMFVFSLNFNAQCLQIESILVDACVPGSGCSSNTAPTCNCEGKNEMIRFKTGNAQISLSDIYVDFPNNTYLGIHSPDATSAAKVASLNSGILACGYLLEPSSGIIPANKQVLFVTSVDMCTTANSFANLNDTLYIIFQVSGNYQGHFANCTGTGNRSLIMGLNSQPTCRDTVTYNCQLLINVNGNYTCTSALMDGSTVNYDVAGNATYVNYGCQAPFTPLSVTATASSNGLCQQNPVTLFASTSGNVSSVSWSGGNGNFSSSNNDTTIYTPSAGDTGIVNIVVSVSTACGNIVTDTVQLSVVALPIVTVSSSAGDTICQGQNTVLSASGGTTYTWQPANLSGNAITVTAGGTYTVVAGNACGTDTSTFSITVNQLPAVTVSSTGNTNLCPGNSLILVAGGADNFSWNTGQSNDSITVNSAGFYWVNGSNNCGADSAGITVTADASPTVTVNAPATVFCSGDSLLLTANTQSGNTLSWIPSGSTNNFIYATSAGTYSVIVQSNCGNDTAMINLQTENALNISVSSTAGDSICNGSSTTLTATGGTNYNWSNGQTGNNINVSASGNYFVVDTNTCGPDTASISITIVSSPTVSLNSSSTLFCSGDSIPLSATTQSGNSITWLPSGNISDTLYATSAGTFTVIAQNICGADSDQVNLQTENPLNLSVNSSLGDTICSGVASTLSASGASTYTWSTGQSGNSITTGSAGNYFVYSSNSCGTDTAFISVATLPLPGITLSSSDDTLCPGESATLTAITTGGGVIFWSNGITGSTSISVTSAGTYYALTSNSCGSDTAQVVLMSDLAPVSQINTSTLIICPGDSSILSASGNGIFTWIPGWQTSSITVYQGGTYQLIAANECGSDTSFVVIQQSAPAAQFTADPSAGLYPLSVNFTNSSTGGNSYFWNFGNGDTSSTFHSSTIFSTPGTYTVSLTVTDQNGCSASASTIIDVWLTEPFLTVPNIFSPNGDTLNEQLSMMHYGVKNFQIEIRDRWGLKMFESTQIEKSWDGRVSGGSEAPEGTYYYIIVAEMVNGKKVELSGYFMLVK